MSLLDNFWFLHALEFFRGKTVVKNFFFFLLSVLSFKLNWCPTNLSIELWGIHLKYNELPTENWRSTATALPSLKQIMNHNIHTQSQNCVPKYKRAPIIFPPCTNIYVGQILKSWSQSVQSLEVIHVFDKELWNCPGWSFPWPAPLAQMFYLVPLFYLLGTSFT